MKAYKKYTFETGDETLRALLAEGLETFEAFEETQTALTAYVPEGDEQDSLDKAREYLSLFGLDLPEYACETVPWENWNAAWEAEYGPTAVDDYVLLYPAHRREEAQEKAPFFRYVLEIDPRMAFGTGRHETTRLCLRALKRLEDAGKLKDAKILDAGCGTGALGLTAALAGGKVAFVDIDPVAVEDTLLNLAANGLDAEAHDVRQGTAGDFLPQTFDVLVANITRNVLIAEKDVYFALLRPGASLVVSGFLTADVPMICDAFPGFELIAHETENEWSCLTFQKLS